MPRVKIKYSSMKGSYGPLDTRRLYRSGDDAGKNKAISVVEDGSTISYKPIDEIYTSVADNVSLDQVVSAAIDGNTDVANNLFHDYIINEARRKMKNA